jgi:hypothetical protein
MCDGCEHNKNHISIHLAPEISIAQITVHVKGGQEPPRRPQERFKSTKGATVWKVLQKRHRRAHRRPGEKEKPPCGGIIPA